MRREIIRLYFIGLMICLLAAPVASRSTFSAARFDKFVNQELSKWRVPGVAIGIIHNGRIILTRGYGYRNLEQKRPVTSKTLFAIGSSTKAFTTLLLGMLADEGKLDWDTPVKQYLPEFEMHEPYVTNHITPKDLVIHNSGLPRHDLSWYGSDASRPDLLKRLAYLEPSRGFRSMFQYQNLMYMTAGYLGGKLNGSTWEEAVKHRIFKPLGMDHSNLDIRESQKTDDYAFAYGEEDKKIKRIPFYEDLLAVGPAGSINSNIQDMMSWLNLHINRGKIGDKSLVLEATLEEMHSPQIVVKGMLFNALEKYTELSAMNYGMGWFVQWYRGTKLVHHGGNIDGFSAMVSFMPHKRSGVVILANKNGTLITLSLILRIYDRLMGLNPIPWSHRLLEFVGELEKSNESDKENVDDLRKTNTTPSHPLIEFTGHFSHPGYGSLTVDLKDDRLQIGYNSLSAPLEHYHYNVFKIREGIGEGLKVQFFSNLKGDIDQISIPFETRVDNIVFTRVADSSGLSREFFENCRGSFQIKGMMLKVDLKSEDVLMLMVPGQPNYELIPYKKTVFNIKGLPSYSVEFVENEDGKINSIILHQPNGDFNAVRVNK